MRDKVWVWTCIDWDLMMDDFRSADGILPDHAWTSPEEAKKAAQVDWEVRNEDEDPEVKQDPPPPLVWQRGSDDYFVAEPQEDMEYRVYALEIYEEVED